MLDVVAVARRLVEVDSRSAKSNVPLNGIVTELAAGFEIEPIDYEDEAGIHKQALVLLRRGESQRLLALSGHLDTVPPTEAWEMDPFRPVETDGRLFGLGSTDMKGPVAAALTAAVNLPASRSVMLLLTTDEETDKQGARQIKTRSKLVREWRPDGIVVSEPSQLRCIRGHRVDVQFRVTAHGVQKHSSQPGGVNANVKLIPFLMDVRKLHLSLRSDPALQDPAYDPTYCDLNMVIDNHGAAPNVTVGRATCFIKFRYSKLIDPSFVIERITTSAGDHGLEVQVRKEAPPPEIPKDHPLVKLTEEISGAEASVAGFGTDASELSEIAPCVIFGPGSMADAHTPHESISIAQLYKAVDHYQQLIAKHTDG